MSCRRPERRKHRRSRISCPAAVLSVDGQELVKGRTVNLSDGGLLISVKADSLPALDGNVQARFSVPRSTPSTYMLEEFSSPARVVRRQPLVKPKLTGIALQFQQDVPLGLEV